MSQYDSQHYQLLKNQLLIKHPVTEQHPILESHRSLAQAPEEAESLNLDICQQIPGPFGLLQPDFQDGEVNVLIEIGSGTKVKYEIDSTGLLLVDRILHSSVYYPVNYGYIPRSTSGDGGFLDVLTISQSSLQPGSYARVRIIGVMGMIDQGEMDDKLVGVLVEDPYYADVTTMDELPQHLLAEIEQFFKTYKNLEDKEVDVSGFRSVEEAVAEVQNGVETFVSLCG